MKRIKFTKFPELDYACTEAVNTLCTNLLFSGEHVKKIMITSSHASEGKSFLAMNVMRSLSKLGKSVVLVDGDLRRSAILKNYGGQFENPEKAAGLAHLLAGKAELNEALYQTDFPRAYIIPVGRRVTNPLPLLNSQNFETLLNALADTVDYVLVDAPPVGMVIDGAQIAKACDGILLAVDYNGVRRQELIDVKNQLEATDCPILGTVLNRVAYDSYMGRKYQYKSYYTSYSEYEKPMLDKKKK